VKDDYTPTTDFVRGRYVEFPYAAGIEEEPADGREFDRWIAGYVKMPSLEALADALDAIPVGVGKLSDNMPRGIVEAEARKILALLGGEGSE